MGKITVGNIIYLYMLNGTSYQYMTNVVIGQYNVSTKTYTETARISKPSGESNFKGAFAIDESKVLVQNEKSFRIYKLNSSNQWENVFTKTYDEVITKIDMSANHSNISVLVNKAKVDVYTISAEKTSFTLHTTFVPADMSTELKDVFISNDLRLIYKQKGINYVDL